MHRNHLPLLLCPKCKVSLGLTKTDAVEGERIKSGTLQCPQCHLEYPVINFIPRFVPAANYSSSFGFQWQLHHNTQCDSFTGLPISRTRLFKETRWPEKLSGEFILEVGSGSGRFTEVLAETGATVVSLDYSEAVEANQRNNAHKANVLIVQASLYELPLAAASFDRVLCLGVLQHTPDVRKSFHALVGALKEGGHLAVDVYRWRWVNLLWPRYWVRSVTKRMPAHMLYGVCRRYVNWIWPLTKVVHRLPLGRKINRFLLVPDFRDTYPLSEELLREWAILDTFDNLSPAYDQPQSLREVSRWFEEAGLKEVEVHHGINGLEGRGRKLVSRD